MEWLLFGEDAKVKKIAIIWKGMKELESLQWKDVVLHRRGGNKNFFYFGTLKIRDHTGTFEAFLDPGYPVHEIDRPHYPLPAVHGLIANQIKKQVL